MCFAPLYYPYGFQSDVPRGESSSHVLLIRSSEEGRKREKGSESQQSSLISSTASTGNKSVSVDIFCPGCAWDHAVGLFFRFCFFFFVFSSSAIWRLYRYKHASSHDSRLTLAHHRRPSSRQGTQVVSYTVRTPRCRGSRPRLASRRSVSFSPHDHPRATYRRSPEQAGASRAVWRRALSTRPSPTLRVLRVTRASPFTCKAKRVTAEAPVKSSSLTHHSSKGERRRWSNRGLSLLKHSFRREGVTDGGTRGD